jgi:hypothetical protein
MEAQMADPAAGLREEITFALAAIVRTVEYTLRESPQSVSEIFRKKLEQERQRLIEARQNNAAALLADLFNASASRRTIIR